MSRAVTGFGWLDWLAVASFAAVTVLSLARLIVPSRSGPVDHFQGGAGHAVMGVLMVAMFWPGGGVLPSRAWVAVLGLSAVWPVLVFARARRPSEPPTSTPPAPAVRAGYYLASALVMIVAFGAGPGTESGAGSGAMAMGSLGSPARHTLTQPAVAAPSAAASALTTASGWPIWPLIGTAFLLYGAWLALGEGRRRPTPELACTLVMAAGMAFMAFSI